jgi:hypothetical protein
MPDNWVAVDAGVDPVSWARLLRRAHDRAVTTPDRDTGHTSRIVRPAIAASWQRSQRAAVDVGDGRAPLILDQEQAERALERHPTAAMLPTIKNLLVTVAEYAHQIVLVADPEGHVLWTAGDSEARRAGERVNLVPGALWSEEATGTNAIGTAIALDHPVQVFSAEHYKRSLHGWSCAAAPLHDSESGAMVGVVALAGPFKNAHPHGLSLVVAAAHIAEAHQRHAATERDERLKVEYLERVLGGYSGASAVVSASGRVLLASPPGWLGARLEIAENGSPVPLVADEVAIEALGRGGGFLLFRSSDADGSDQRPTLRIDALGRERATGTLGKRSFEFTRRHSEILVILAQHPEGLTEERLADEVYGARVKSVTIRAEISRLRRCLGPVVCTRPYRVAASVRGDFLELLALAECGEVGIGAEHVAGPLLPTSTAPGVVKTRERLARALSGKP